MPYLVCPACGLTEYTAAANRDPDVCARCGAALVVRDRPAQRGQRAAPERSTPATNDARDDY